MKLHRNLYEGIISSLEFIFIRGYYADKVLEKLFKANRQWGSRDRGVIAETVYDMVRHWRRINALNGTDFLKPDVNNFDALLQVYFFAIKKEEYRFEWKSPLDKARIEKVQQHINAIPEVQHSIPDWLHEKGLKQYGDQWLNELQALNEPAPLVIRANTLKDSTETVKNELAKAGVNAEFSELTSQALILQRRINVFSTDLFKNGQIEVQDEGSQVIGDFCGVKPGMRVIDACAGAGGKSLHLAALMQNKGKIVSMDVEQWKLDEMKKRARRSGAFNIEPRLIEGTKTIKKLEASADLVLLDVPCSGTGVLRRNPDAKWKMKPDFVEKIKRTQAEILASYSQMVKPGGILVYSTCSILQEENQDQVEKFLKENPSFKLEEEKVLTPFTNRTDGFYMARMKRI